MRKRKTSSAPTDQDSAAAPVATPNTSRVSAKTCRRPIPVGQQPAERRAQRHPDEADRADPGQLGRRTAPTAPAQRGHDEGDEADVHGVQRPAQPGADDQPAVLPGEGSRSSRAARVSGVAVAVMRAVSASGRSVAAAQVLLDAVHDALPAGEGVEVGRAGAP